MALTEKLVGIANAIRSKTDITHKLTLDDMAINVDTVWSNGEKHGYDAGKIDGRVAGFRSVCRDGWKEVTAVATAINNQGRLVYGKTGGVDIRGITSAWLNKSHYEVTYVCLEKNGNIIMEDNHNLPIDSYLGQDFYFDHPLYPNVHYPDLILIELSHYGEGGEAFYIPTLNVSVDGSVSYPTSWIKNPDDAISSLPTYDEFSSMLKFDRCSRARVNLIDSAVESGTVITSEMRFKYEPDAQVSIRWVQGDTESLMALLTVSGVSNTLDIENSDTSFTTLAALSPNKEYKLKIEVTNTATNMNGRNKYKLYLDEVPLFDEPREFFKNGPFAPVFLEVYNEARARVPIGVIRK